jgi:hypothetical protein
MTQEYSAFWKAWWNSSWTKRQPLTVTNNTATELTDYQIQIDVEYDSDMQSDFDDLRFISSSDVELSYWIESKTDEVSAVVWVKVDSIPASDSTVVYMYYGNPSASSTSNGDNTFIFFDDFDGLAIDETKWTITNATGWSVSGGELKGTNTSGRLTSVSTYSEGITLEISHRYVTRPSGGYMVGGFWLTTSNSFGYLSHSTDNYRNNGSWVAIGTPAPGSTNLFTQINVKTTALVDLYVSNYDTAEVYKSYPNISNNVASEPIVLGYRYDNSNGNQGYEAYWDWIRIRSYAATEPSITTTAEETPTSVPYSPTDNSLGIIEYDPDKYNGQTVYLDAVASLDGVNYTRVRSNLLTLPDSAKDYTVRVRPGDGTLSPTIQLYNITDGIQAGTVSIGSSSDLSIYVKSARLIIPQSHPSAITETQGQIEVGNTQTSTSPTYAPLDDKKIYNYDSSAFEPAPDTHFEAGLKSVVTDMVIEQQINIVNQLYSATGTAHQPTDNSLGIIRWDGSKYPGATVYFEAVISRNSSRMYAQLYTTAGGYVTNSQVTIDSGGWHRLRSGPINLENGVEYTARVSNINNGNTTTIRAARLIIIQSDETKITDTQAQIEVGHNEATTETSYTPLTHKKIYHYDASKFSATPTAYFEASLKGGGQPTIEQQINIVNQLYSATGTAHQPTDNSLGIIRWDGSKYPGATVYFEAVISRNSSRMYAQLYTTAGGYVTNSQVTIDSGGWHRLRSGPINLENGVEYTARVSNINNGNTTTIRAARLIIIQSDETKITDTQAQIEVGHNEATTETSYTPLTHKKIYHYDASKFSATPTAYFEASLKGGGQPTIEQQINIVNQLYSATGTAHQPTDNSLGIIRWDGSKYPGATVYFEAVISRNSSRMYAQLYTTAGGYVTNSQVTIDSGGWHRLRSGPINLENGVEYTARVSNINIGNTTTIRAARLIIIQSDETKITDTQAQIEVGHNEATTETSYTPLTHKKIYHYDASKFSATPSAYFEATLSNDTAEATTSAALYKDGSSCTTQISGSEVSVTGTTWSLERSDAITLSTNTGYMVCIKASDGTAHITNAKIILDQSDVNGITDTEIIHQQVNRGVSTTSSSYVNQVFYNRFNPELESSQVSFAGGNFNYFFESTLKTSAGTGYAQLNYATSASEVTTTNTDYERVRSGDITSSLPSFPSTYNAVNLDTQIRNSASNTTTASSSWLVVQVTNLSTTGGATAYAELYNLTDGVAVTDSEVPRNVSTWGLERSGPITLTSGKEYVVRVKTDSSVDYPIYISNAKIILDQSDVNGITDTEIIHQQVNRGVSTTSSSYVNQVFYNRFNPELESSQVSFAGGNFNYFFESTLKTSAGTGYAQLNYATSASEVTTTNTDYERVRSGDITSSLPSFPSTYNAVNLDTQIRNSASNTTTASSSWLVVQVTNLSTTGGATAYAELYNLTDGVAVTDSEVPRNVSTWGLERSGPITLTSGKEYVVRVKTDSSVDYPIYISNAKIILDQSDVNGIRATEMVHQQVNHTSSSSSSSYVSQNFLNYYNPDSFRGGVFNYRL